MVPSRIVRTTVYVDVCHDKDGGEYVAGLLNAAQVIAMKAEKTHMMECGHRRWDFVNRCKDVKCLDCGHKEPLAEIHKEHIPFKECADRDCPQCDRGE